MITFNLYYNHSRAYDYNVYYNIIVYTCIQKVVHVVPTIIHAINFYPSYLHFQVYIVTLFSIFENCSSSKIAIFTYRVCRDIIRQLVHLSDVNNMVVVANKLLLKSFFFSSSLLLLLHNYSKQTDVRIIFRAERCDFQR